MFLLKIEGVRNRLFQALYSHAGAQRKDEPKETDPHRIAQRQKQVDYGKNTLGYQRYTEEIPR